MLDIRRARQALPGARRRARARGRRRLAVRRARRVGRALRPERLRQDDAAEADRGACSAPDSGEVPSTAATSRALSATRGGALPPAELGFVLQSFHLIAGRARRSTTRRSSCSAPACGVREAHQRMTPLLTRLGLDERAEPPRRAALDGRAPAGRDRARRSSTEPGAAARRRADRQPRHRSAAARCSTLLRELCRERDVAILLVTHDPQAAAFADRVLALRDGRLVEYEPDAPRSDDRRRLRRSEHPQPRSGSTARACARAAVQELLALVGIAIGVALLFAVQVANRASARSVDAADARARRQTRSCSSSRAARTASTSGCCGEVAGSSPGVRAAAPMLEAQANVIGPTAASARSTLLGGRPALARARRALLRDYHRRAARAAAGARAAAPLARRARRRVRRARSTLDSRGGATRRGAGRRRRSARSDVGALVDSPVVARAAALRAAARRHAGPRHARSSCAPRPGRDAQVEAALRRIAGDAPRRARRPTTTRRCSRRRATPNDQSTALFAAISALVGFLFAFNAMLLTVPRAPPADRRAAHLGAMAADASCRCCCSTRSCSASSPRSSGSLLGDLLSRHVFHAVARLPRDRVPGRRPARSSTPRASLLALARRDRSRRCSRRCAPLRDLLLRGAPLGRGRPRRRRDRRRRRSCARRGSLLGGGVLARRDRACCCSRPTAAIVGIGAARRRDAAAAAARCSPASLALVDRARTRASRSVVPVDRGRRAARPATRRARSRIAATARDRGLRQRRDRGRARATCSAGSTATRTTQRRWRDLWVVRRGAREPARDRRRSRAARSRDATRRRQASRRSRAYRGSFLDVGDRRVWVIGAAARTAAPIPPSQLVDGRPRAMATQRLRAGGWAVVSEALATRARRCSVGDRFALPSPRPTRAAASPRSRRTSAGRPGAIVLNADDYRARVGQRRRQRAAGRRSRRASPPAAGSGSCSARSARDSALAVETAAAREQRHRATTRAGPRPPDADRDAVLIAAMLAMAAAMGGMIWQRRRRARRLKLAGYRRPASCGGRCCSRARCCSALGCSVGAVFGLYGQQLLDRALRRGDRLPRRLLDRRRSRAGQPRGRVPSRAAIVCAGLPGRSGPGGRRIPRLTASARRLISWSGGACESDAAGRSQLRRSLRLPRASSSGSCPPCAGRSRAGGLRRAIPIRSCAPTRC